jgi:hypothetical protein
MDVYPFDDIYDEDDRYPCYEVEEEEAFQVPFRYLLDVSYLLEILFTFEFSQEVQDYVNPERTLHEEPEKQTYGVFRLV